jgi:hypothetical protein
MFGQLSHKSYRSQDRNLLISWFDHEKGKRHSLRGLAVAKDLAQVDPTLTIHGVHT